MSLDFETIKRECEPGVSVFISPENLEYIYVGFLDRELITSDECDKFFQWHSNESVKDWIIKKEPQVRKLYAYKNRCCDESGISFRFTDLYDKHDRVPEFDLSFSGG